MTDGEILTSPPKCSYYLVSSADAVQSRSESILSRLDETAGIQSDVMISDLLSEAPYDRILRSAKVSSRYGKSLLDTYFDEIETRAERVDESALANELEAQFGKNDADPYQAELTADILSIGLDIEAKLGEAIESPNRHTFNQDDLAAAVGFAAEHEGVQSMDCFGAVLVRLDTPLSKLVENRSTGGLSSVVQTLLLAGLNVYFVGPSGGPDELEIVRDQFRTIGSFSIEQETEVEFNVSSSTEEFVDEWYERLSFDVADGRVGESVIRPASVAAYDLPNGEERRHFFRAIVDGLQVTYAEQKSDDERFDDLWSERITPHPEYDQYRSQRSSFPRVKLARRDGRQREFRLTYRGPNTKPYINGVPVRSEDIEAEFVKLLKRFLDADTIPEEQWDTYLREIRTSIGDQMDINPESIAENALLRRERVRTSLVPLIGPAQSSDTERPLSEEDKGSEWYGQHWRTILSSYKITTTAGTNIIEKKEELCTELDPDSAADSALYYKLQRDIENAWTYYLEEFEKQVRRSLPDELAVELHREEADSRTDVEITVHPPDAESVTTTVSVYLPFSDVRVNGKNVSRANVPTVVARVLETFEGVLYSRSGTADTNTTELLLSLIRLYCDVTGVNQGDQVYFEEIVRFAQSLPDVSEAFQEPDQSATESMYQKLGSRELMAALRDEGVRFHRKGSDDRESVKVRGDQYIAMELRNGVPQH